MDPVSLAVSRRMATRSEAVDRRPLCRSKSRRTQPPSCPCEVDAEVPLRYAHLLSGPPCPFPADGARPAPPGCAPDERRKPGPPPSTPPPQATGCPYPANEARPSVRAPLKRRTPGPPPSTPPPHSAGQPEAAPRVSLQSGEIEFDYENCFDTIPVLPQNHREPYDGTDSSIAHTLYDAVESREDGMGGEAGYLAVECGDRVHILSKPEPAHLRNRFDSYVFAENVAAGTKGWLPAQVVFSGSSA